MSYATWSAQNSTFRCFDSLIQAQIYAAAWIDEDVIILRTELERIFTCRYKMVDLNFLSSSSDVLFQQDFDELSGFLLPEDLTESMFIGRSVYFGTVGVSWLTNGSAAVSDVNVNVLLTKVLESIGGEVNQTVFKTFLKGIHERVVALESRHPVNFDSSLEGYVLSLFLSLLPPAVVPVSSSHIAGTLQRFDARLRSSVNLWYNVLKSPSRPLTLYELRRCGSSLAVKNVLNRIKTPKNSKLIEFLLCSDFL